MTKSREVAVADQATVTRDQARIFFNMGKGKFLRRWDQYYRHRIRSVDTRGGLKLLLIDVVAAAFPTATKGQIQDIAYKGYEPDSCKNIR